MATQIRQMADPFVAVTSTASRLLSEGGAAPESQFEDDWEDLDGCDQEPSKKETIVTINSKFLRHSASSPNLGGLDDDFIIQNVQEGGRLETQNDEESFSLVSSVASVQSMSTQSMFSPESSLSWRDRVMKVVSDGDHGNLPIRTDVPSRQQQRQQQQRRTKTTRYVVVSPLTRSTKSMSDLGSLVEEEEEEEVLGETDAMEFYQRKALGAAHRSSGLRMRPDEAKRKAFALEKRAMQRNGGS